MLKSKNSPEATSLVEFSRSERASGNRLRESSAFCVSTRTHATKNLRTRMMLEQSGEWYSTQDPSGHGWLFWRLRFRALRIHITQDRPKTQSTWSNSRRNSDWTSGENSCCTHCWDWCDWNWNSITKSSRGSWKAEEWIVMWTKYAFRTWNVATPIRNSEKDYLWCSCGWCGVCALTTLWLIATLQVHEDAQMVSFLFHTVDNRVTCSSSWASHALHAFGQSCNTENTISLLTRLIQIGSNMSTRGWISSELPEERTVEEELCSTTLERSCTEENHEKRIRNPAKPTCNRQSINPVWKRKWHHVPACSSFTRGTHNSNLKLCDEIGTSSWLRWARFRWSSSSTHGQVQIDERIWYPRSTRYPSKGLVSTSVRRKWENEFRALRDRKFLDVHPCNSRTHWWKHDCTGTDGSSCNVPCNLIVCIFHWGCFFGIKSSLATKLLTRGRESNEGRQTIFFTPLTPSGENSDEKESSDDPPLPRKKHCYRNWKPYQDALHWIKKSPAQDLGWQLWQMKSNATLVHDPLPEDCIYKIIFENTNQILFQILQLLDLHQGWPLRVNDKRSSCDWSSIFNTLRVLHRASGNRSKSHQNQIRKEREIKKEKRMNTVPHWIFYRRSAKIWNWSPCWKSIWRCHVKRLKPTERDHRKGGELEDWFTDKIFFFLTQKKEKQSRNPSHARHTRTRLTQTRSEAHGGCLPPHQKPKECHHPHPQQHAVKERQREGSNTAARQQGTPPHLPSLSGPDLKNTRHTSRLRLGELLEEVGGLVRPSAPNFSSQDDQSCSAVAFAQLGAGSLVEGCAVHVSTSPVR